MRRKVRDRTKFQVNLNIFKLLSILLIVIFIFFIPFIIQKLIKITKIECETQFGPCPDEMVNNVSYVVNGDYKTAKKGIETVLASDLQVNNYLIQYKIPSTIKIDINLKKPKYAIKNKDNNYYLVSNDGILVKFSNESNLPLLIRNDVTYNLGDRISNSDKFALELIEKTAWSYPVQESVIENGIFKVKLEDGIVLLFPLDGDTDVLTGSLRLIFSRLNDGSEGIRMEDVREIDLRFKNPILR